MDPFSLGWHLPGFVVIIAALIWLSVIDLRTKTLPRRIIYLTAALGLPWLALQSVNTGTPSSLLTSLIGAVAGLIAFGSVHLLTKGALGAGDVRMAVLLGAVLGWINPLLAPIGLLLGLVLASVTGLILIATRTLTRHDPIALGPFLNFGALLTVIGASMSPVDISSITL
jgi:leader peptidase (prepilin peptidase)/N-methyltransferase